MISQCLLFRSSGRPRRAKRPPSSPLHGPKEPRRAPGRAHAGPRGAQMAQEGPQSGSRQPKKRAPFGAQDGPRDPRDTREPQDGPIWAQDGPSTGQEVLKRPPNQSPNASQILSVFKSSRALLLRMASGALQMAPRPKTAPPRPKKTPRRPLAGPKGFQVALTGKSPRDPYIPRQPTSYSISPHARL